MSEPGRGAVGLLGGTFNPIHLGHLRAAEEAAEVLGLERVVFVPAAAPPHKTGEHVDPIAPASLRLAWTQMAVADNPRFDVDPLEVKRRGPSYTVDTLRAFGERLAPERPVFLIGCDAFREIDTWRAPRELVALAHFAVMTRPPVRHGSLVEWIPAPLAADFELAPDGHSGRHRSAGTWIRVVEIASLEISASDLRRRLREGRSVRYLLPEPVREAVLAAGVYGPAPVASGTEGRTARQGSVRTRP